MTQAAGQFASRYPIEVRLGNDRTVQLRLMGPGDVDAVLAFARALDPDDLLFLRVNITEPSVVQRWVHNIESGRTITVLALDEAEAEVVGEASLLYNRTSWTRHLGEIRIQIAPPARRQGLARVLAAEIEAISTSLGLRMLTARMTLDQTSTQAVFRNLGFQREAVLWDYVMTADGKTRNLLVATKRLAQASDA